MDLTTIDITAVPEAGPDDVAVLIGRQGGDAIGADALAAAAGTIPWEILARIGGRVPRVVLGQVADAGPTGSAPPLERGGAGAL